MPNKSSIENIRLRRTKSASADEVRHSLAHLLAEAVLKKYPGTKLGIGPTIENGFYYDFLFKKPLTPEELPELEKEIRSLIRQNLAFKRKKITPREAKKIFKGQLFKLELIKELIKERRPLSIYITGKKLPHKSASNSRESAFVDLCKGPHIKNTSEINPDAFKLTHIAGAYWKGSEKNQMLTRIYGLAFNTKKELDDYLKIREEAEKRDHRKLGQDLDLFSAHEEFGPGLIYWHPKGGRVRTIMEDFWRKEHYKNGYEIIYTPHIGKATLWETSGHLDFYKENMYSPMEIDKDDYYIKPMNCPFHILIYKNKMRSYRDLPMRLAELGTVYRYEKAGVLHGLLRVRGFTQDDAHLICTPEQMPEEIKKVVEFSIFILKSFGFSDFKIYLATTPKKRVGKPQMWKQAIAALKKALDNMKLTYETDEGGGAFYGPKIDIKIKDALGREWQCSTIQFDFNLPERFKMEYIGQDGKPHRPYMIHRALMGSLERFFGTLIEHYAGAFPVWLAPLQTIILPISEKQNDYAEKVLKELKENGIRAELDDSNETLGKKIRAAELQKIPYIIVIGDKEIESGKVAVRERGKKEIETIKLEDFIENCRNLIPEILR